MLSSCRNGSDCNDWINESAFYWIADVPAMSAKRERGTSRVSAIQPSGRDARGTITPFLFRPLPLPVSRLYWAHESDWLMIAYIGQEKKPCTQLSFLVRPCF